MALVLKPHIVGRNPLNIEPILDSVRNFTNQRRFGGGYSASDIALHDIAGKVYGVPVWGLIGSQYRNRVRCYCDTTESSDPKIYAARMAARGTGDAPRNWRAYKEIKEATVTPINTGESLFGLEEGFRPLIENTCARMPCSPPASRQKPSRIS
jgi:L-alanine-DL-glutamate epimerase-like enolase superfamily enzyme